MDENFNISQLPDRRFSSRKAGRLRSTEAAVAASEGERGRLEGERAIQHVREPSVRTASSGIKSHPAVGRTRFLTSLPLDVRKTRIVHPFADGNAKIPIRSRTTSSQLAKPDLQLATSSQRVLSRYDKEPRDFNPFNAVKRSCTPSMGHGTHLKRKTNRNIAGLQLELITPERFRRTETGEPRKREKETPETNETSYVSSDVGGETKNDPLRRKKRNSEAAGRRERK
ncbi:hypothetical protein GWI33_006286 [Rhynchophorus ferrugineus]|uniref:Uncharacterized protein n=1 Tax=Rhynchophorus ferrugineus TaxID=354439 RepID=A0A834MD59_RHYFE|nr:hypothetical protein GWI33_006286 [Rhynchophorus ferrugineus]